METRSRKRSYLLRAVVVAGTAGAMVHCGGKAFDIGDDSNPDTACQGEPCGSVGQPGPDGSLGGGAVGLTSNPDGSVGVVSNPDGAVGVVPNPDGAIGVVSNPDGAVGVVSNPDGAVGVVSNPDSGGSGSGSGIPDADTGDVHMVGVVGVVHIGVIGAVIGNE